MYRAREKINVLRRKKKGNVYHEGGGEAKDSWSNMSRIAPI
jgi:hypothetical protein